MVHNKKFIYFLLFFFHISFSWLVYSIANSDLLTHLHNGEGIWHFASDADLYRQEGLVQLEYLLKSDWWAWLASYNNHLNVKLISLSYWITGNHTLMSLSIIHAIVWVFSVTLIFKSSKLIFPKHIYLPFIIVLCFFLQPSILFQSTQPLRDPYLILGICTFIYGWTILENNHPRWHWFFYMIISFILIISIRSYLFPALALPTIFYMIWVVFKKKWMLPPFIVLVILMVIFQSSAVNSLISASTIIQNARTAEAVHIARRVIEKNEFNKVTKLDLSQRILLKKQYENEKKRLEIIVIKSLDLFKSQYNQSLDTDKKALQDNQSLDTDKKALQVLLSNEEKRLYIITNNTLDLFESELLIPSPQKKQTKLTLSNISSYEENVNKLTTIPAEKNKIILKESLKVQDRTEIEIPVIALLNSISRHIGELRFDFTRAIKTGSPGSVIDLHIHIRDFRDLVRYLPRAAQISFLAPFPSSWLTTGSTTGGAAKLLSGIEVFFWYFVLSGFLYSIFVNLSIMRLLIPVFIFSFGIILLLGLVIPVVGTIYRMRQGYMIPFYMFGIYGLHMIFDKFYNIYFRLKQNS